MFQVTPPDVGVELCDAALGCRFARLNARTDGLHVHRAANVVASGHTSGRVLSAVAAAQRGGVVASYCEHALATSRASWARQAQPA